jgi:hypothetical protein
MAGKDRKGKCDGNVMERETTFNTGAQKCFT